MPTVTQQIPTTRLGRSGPVVGVQGLGCMGMATGLYGPTDGGEALAALDRALERGVSLFDTSSNYGRGSSERFIGPFIRANRDRVTIATKVGFVPVAEPGQGVTVSNRPEYIRRTVEESLQRLGIEVIDLLYLHRRDPAVELAESIGAMAELVSSGKVRFLGICSATAAELREAHAIHPISAIESEWSIFTRDIESEVVPTASELGIGIVPFSPLGKGQLTGAVNMQTLESGDMRKGYPRFQEDNDALIDTVRRVAARKDATPAQVGLAWVQRQSTQFDVAVVPIPGSRKAARVDENADSVFLELSADDIAELDSLSSQVRGHRTNMVLIRD